MTYSLICVFLKKLNQPLYWQFLLTDIYVNKYTMLSHMNLAMYILCQ